MIYKVTAPKGPLIGDLQLPSSKSESNRALIIQALSSKEISLKNLSESDDTQTLIKLLRHVKDGQHKTLNAGHAGTTFRFLCAYLSTIEGASFTLTGSDRMRQRPCGVLVESLQMLGADIQYLEKEGYPPLQINGKKFDGGSISMKGNVSSQFISALMLIAPELSEGLNISFTTPLVSYPYLKMTADLMSHFGADVELTKSSVVVGSKAYSSRAYHIESDWSAASYWYEMLAFREGDVMLKGLKKESLQGDSIVAKLFQGFGIESDYTPEGVRIKRSKLNEKEQFNSDFTEYPDLAQTLCCTLAGLGIEAHLTGLSTLKIKETDRIVALANELSKFNVAVETTNDSIHVKSAEIKTNSEQIKTYHDHRMAMAFAPLALKTNTIFIDDPEVVAKSYPNFWKDLEMLGFGIEEC